MNYYDILGIESDATQDEIKIAYRNMIKAFHPDYYHGDKAFAEKKSKEINRAYETLSDIELRKQYDYKEGITSKQRSNRKSDSEAYKKGDYSTNTRAQKRNSKEKSSTNQWKGYKYRFDSFVNYPGFKATGDWYSSSRSYYSLPTNVNGYRSDIDYSERPTCEDFGISSDEINKIKNEFGTFCSSGIKKLDQAKLLTDQFEKDKKDHKDKETLAFIFFSFGILDIPGLLIMTGIILYNIIKGSYSGDMNKIWFFNAIYVAVSVFVYMKLDKEETALKNRPETKIYLRLSDIPEKFRRYIQYEYATREYENYWKQHR